MLNRRGFTLIEILITLAILSAMTLLTTQSIQQAIKSKVKIQDQMDDVSKLRDALKLMERDINLAFHYNDIESEMDKLIAKYKKSGSPSSGGPTSLPGSPNYTYYEQDNSPKATRQSPVTHFMGEAEKINFVTMNNARVVRNSRQADFVEVGYELKECKSLNPENSSGKCLWRRSSPYADEDVTRGGQEVALLEHISEFKLRYIGKGKQDWVSEWKSGVGADGATKDKFPDAVEISITFEKQIKGKSKKYSMQIVAPLHFPNNMEPVNTGSPSAIGGTPPSSTGGTSGN